MISSSVEVSELRRRLESSSAPLFLVVDIGATNCRFGFLKNESATPLPQREIFFSAAKAGSVEELESVSSTMAAALGTNVTRRIVAAAVNVPGPVTDGRLGGPIANYRGTDRVVKLDRLPASLFPKGKSIMLNDLEAGAYGVLAASQFGTFDKLFKVMWLAKDLPKSTTFSSIGDGHCVVLAPGTGLGTATVVFDNLRRNHVILPLEFGHTSVQSATAKSFLKAYKQEVDRGNYEVEYDDLCSGRGLERMYKHITGGDKKNAAAISDMGKNKDHNAVGAMKMYNKFLMRLSSQLSIGLVPRCIVLCGDNVVKNAFYYEKEENVEAMRRQLLEHSMERHGFMSRVSMLRQIYSGSINLFGCAYVCATLTPATAKL